MEENYAKELQERLVQCCIDFIKEKGMKEVDEVDFTIYDLEESVKHGSWHPSSDSSCKIWKYGKTCYESL